MVDTNIVAEKLKQLSRSIAKVRAHCPADPAELAAGSDALDLVSFNLLLAVQTCLDLASHLIADEGWAPAAKAREAFERLSEHGVLSSETAQALAQAVGLRNIVAHGYAGADPAQIHTAATAGLADLERFATEVSGWVERGTESPG
jgi:uncharacterized protein YutE (UPF0331/DUF86 family)